jgi:hypothetical protein
MKVEENKVNRAKLWIVAGAFALASIPFYATGNFGPGQYNDARRAREPLPICILNPGIVLWFQKRFLSLFRMFIPEPFVLHYEANANSFSC